MEIKLNRTRIGIQLDPRSKRIIFAVVSFFGNLAVIVLDFAHKVLDRVIAFSLHGIMRGVGHGLFVMEEWLYDYLKKSKYVQDDQFEQKYDEETVVFLASGIAQAKSITIREIMEKTGVSFHIARTAKELTKKENRLELLKKLEEALRDYRSDSEKNDKRSLVQ